VILRSKKIVLDLIHHSKERKRERKEREKGLLGARASTTNPI
jgi:hypothetical protein